MYAVWAIFQPCNGGLKNINKNINIIKNKQMKEWGVPLI